MDAVRWKRLARALVIAILFASSRPVLAEGLPVEPGLWEVSYSMPDPLRGEPIAQVQRTCVRDRVITAERVNSKLNGCRITNAVVRGPSARWKMRCDTPAGPMTGTGSLKSSPVAVSGSVEMSMTIGSLEIPMTGAFHGRRIGDCRGTPAPGAVRPPLPSPKPRS